MSTRPNFALAKPVQPPKPAEEPDWNRVKIESEEAVLSQLVDPGSATITWPFGFKWGSYKPMLKSTNFGWVTCGFFNAKNRMGGFVGRTPFIIVYNERVSFVQIAAHSSEFDITRATCANSDLPAPQKEFIVSTERETSTGLSIADEIEKLAKLRDQGILTEEEFKIRKTKLLDRP